MLKATFRQTVYRSDFHKLENIQADPSLQIECG